jgi:hypothetical protein
MCVRTRTTGELIGLYRLKGSNQQRGLLDALLASRLFIVILHRVCRGSQCRAMRSMRSRQRHDGRGSKRLKSETTSYWVAYLTVLVIGATLMILALI